LINNKNYALLEKRVFLKFLLILTVITIALFNFAALIRGTFGDTIVAILENVFLFDNQSAIYFYQQAIRKNIYTIMLLILLIITICMFRMILSSITKYFDAINVAVENLVSADKEIFLPPELSFMQIKLQICKDTLEKKEREARIAEQKKNDLVVYLAHDIKTPLTSVIGYLELMKELPDMPLEQRAKYIKITLDKATRLEQLINEFFEITRFNLNSIVLQKKQFNLTFMIEQLVDEFYPMLQTKNNTISLQVPENIMVYGDSDKLSRVFNNIIKNAVSYSHSNSEISITLNKEGSNIVVTITNVGDTMEKEQLNSIFEKFYRLDSARSTQTGGAGLGLAIAKEIIMAHNGAIKATSNDTIISFIVTLPS
jgi:two-component system sensor histidine kinase VanS